MVLNCWYNDDGYRNKYNQSGKLYLKWIILNMLHFIKKIENPIELTTLNIKGNIHEH